GANGFVHRHFGRALRTGAHRHAGLGLAGRFLAGGFEALGGDVPTLGIVKRDRDLAGIVRDAQDRGEFTVLLIEDALAFEATLDLHDIPRWVVSGTDALIAGSRGD